MAHLTAKNRKRVEVDGDAVHRTCISCRQVSQAQDLLRFVRAPDGTIAFDVRGRADGRGAYTCASASCLERAVQKRALARAFDEAISVELNALMADVKASLAKRILENLGLGFRAGQCVSGRTKAQEEIEANRAIALMVSNDLSARSCRDIGLGTGEKSSGIAVLRGPDKELTGQALGKLETGVVALLKGRISDRIICDLKRYQTLCGFSQVSE